MKADFAYPATKQAIINMLRAGPGVGENDVRIGILAGTREGDTVSVTGVFVPKQVSTPTGAVASAGNLAMALLEMGDARHSFKPSDFVGFVTSYPKNMKVVETETSRRTRKNRTDLPMVGLVMNEAGDHAFYTD